VQIKARKATTVPKALRKVDCMFVDVSNVMKRVGVGYESLNGGLSRREVVLTGELSYHFDGLATFTYKYNSCEVVSFSRVLCCVFL
jgi:hypothetical protein